MAAPATPPQIECVLQGAISDDNVGLLLERLRGLCSSEMALYYREIAFKTLPGLSPSELRARCHLITTDLNNTAATTIGDPDNNISSKWTLRYQGTPLIKEKSNVTIRMIVDVETSDNICSFLELMGFRADFEFVAQGHKFTAHNKTLTASVFQIRRSQGGQLDGVDLFNKMWLVETSCTSPDESYQHAVDHVASFSDYLLPYVELHKIDHRGLTPDTKAPTPHNTTQPALPAQYPITMTTPSSFSTPSSPRHHVAPPGSSSFVIKKETKRK